MVTVNEIFFGGERVVNNGDSHIDFEFLQNTVAFVPDSTGCAGTFSGDRAQGDMLLSVDFTSGGTFGGDILYQWHCAATLAIRQRPPAGGLARSATRRTTARAFRTTSRSATRLR